MNTGYSPLPDPEAFRAGSGPRLALECISDKWTAMIICALATGPQRYGVLRRTIGGVSQKVLTQNLRRLERNGLVKRIEYPSRPRRVEYALTPLGVTLIEPLTQVRIWAETHYKELLAARGYTDSERSSEQQE